MVIACLDSDAIGTNSRPNLTTESSRMSLFLIASYNLVSGEEFISKLISITSLSVTPIDWSRSLKPT